MNTQQENQISGSNDTSAHPLSVGKTLREAREKLGMSVNDVANRIKFAPRQIESLEDDDYAHLPEAAFVRGFVRSYARLLELDPARLLSGLPSSHSKTASVPEVKSVEVPMPSAALSARRYNIVLLLAGLVIALAVAIYMRTHDRSPKKAGAPASIKVEPIELPNYSTQQKESDQLAQPEQPVAATPQETDEREAVEAAAPPPLPKPVAHTVAPPVAPAVQPKPQHAVRSAPVPVPAPAPAAAHATATETVTSTVAAAATQVQAKATAGSNESRHALRLEFDEDAWVEVKDGDDKVLISKMHSAGSLLRVTGKSPLSVTIGNARAVRLFDNGKKINLERFTIAEVAHLILK